MNVETAVAYYRHRKRSLLFGTFGMCLLGVMIGIIASSQGLKSAFDNKVLTVLFELEDDNQVIQKIIKKINFL